MGAKGAVQIIFRSSDDKEKAEESYIRAFASPIAAANRGFIDDIIDPRTTRARLCSDLKMLRMKKLKNPWKKHGNMPL